MKSILKIICGVFLLLVGAAIVISQLYAILTLIKTKETPDGSNIESSNVVSYLFGWIIFSAIAVVAIKYAVKLLRGGAREDQIDDDVLKNP